MLITFDESSRF